MITILNYLNELKPSPVSEAWTTISKMMADLNLGRDEIYNDVMDAQREGLVRIKKSLEPVPFGLKVVGITGKGRQRLKMNGFNHMTTPTFRRGLYIMRAGPL